MKKILVIGTGSIGERHLRCLQNTGRSTVGMVEVNEKLRGEVAMRYGVDDAFASLDEALKTGWDGAVIATPAPLHIPIALQLARKGIHMLIEKPLSVNLDGIEELLKLVRERNLVAGVAYVYRVHPALEAMREALLGRRFGKPVEVVVNCGQHFPFYRPAYREIYYVDRAKGGGAIQDALTHLLNASEWLVGPIDRLVADADHLVLEGVEVEDTVHLIARHGPVMASYSLNQHQSPNETTITVNCEHGTVRGEFAQKRWRWISGPEDCWHDEVFELPGRDDWFIRQAHAFLDVLEGTREIYCTLEEGLQTLKVNLAALESVETGGWRDIR